MTAYCAPGRTWTTALTLMLRGEHADRIEETPYLAGQGIILLIPAPWPDRQV